jgi:hypothetical protein
MIYYSPKKMKWIDKKTGNTVTVPRGYPSDGASGPAIDIYSNAWWYHDVLCDRGTWDNGLPCTAKDASRVLKDVLICEGRWARARYWGLLTWCWTALVGVGRAGLKVAIPSRAGEIYDEL